MNMNRKKVFSLSAKLILLVVAIMLTSCSTGSKMTGSWSDTTVSDPVKGKILVIGVARNETHQRIFEDSLVANLEAEGVTTVAGHTLTSEQIKPDKEAIVALVQKAGAEAVLVTHVIGSEEMSSYFPAIGGTFVSPGYYGGLYSYYPMVYNYVYMPAQNFSKEIVTLETGLYDARTGKLLWVGRSEAVNPEMTKKYYTSLTKLFVRDLRKKELI
jgi:hypothetical protein